MLNNPAIDIAIGLVFIYAIYSLITTTLTELISTWMNLRGRVLRSGLRRMLDDQDKKDGSNEVLSTTFLNYPEFKYLGKKSMFTGQNKLPSYMKPKTFAKTLLNVLDKAYESEMDLTVVKDKLNPQSPTHQHLIRIIEEAEHKTADFKVAAEEWYNETMDRVSGWYKKKVQLTNFIVGLAIALSMNINTIDIAKKLGQDEKSRIALIEASSNYAQSYNALDSLYEDDLEKIEGLHNQIEGLLKESQQMESIIDINYPSCEDSAKTWFIYFLGCIITAIALSVGSPFWFDLLNKLVKLRSSGTQERSNISASLSKKEKEH